MQWGLIHSKDHGFIEYLQYTKFCTRSGTSRSKETQLCPQGATRLPGRGVGPQYESIQALHPSSSALILGPDSSTTGPSTSPKPRGESEERGRGAVQTSSGTGHSCPTTLKPGASASLRRGIALVWGLSGFQAPSRSPHWEAGEHCSCFSRTLAQGQLFIVFQLKKQPFRS